MSGRWETILAIDSDPHACATYAANMQGVEVRCERVGDSPLPRADVVIGGPPCQPFSVAGKRAGGADSRDAVPAFLAAIEAVRPRMFLMEQVPGFLTAEDGAYAQRTVAAMEAAGYAVEWRVLDACHFGVPQRRQRAWFWGIRRSLGLEQRWPRPTHAWPLPEGDCMFGADLPGAVTVGEALGLTGDIGMHPHGNMTQTSMPSSMPAPTVRVGRLTGGGDMLVPVAIRRARGASVDRRDHPADEPCPTIGDGSGGSGSVLRVVGGGVNPHYPGDIRTERDITDETSTTILGNGGNALPAVHTYRWSDAMRAKHPPASPASPAPTVQAKWAKGGAEGLLEIETKQKRTRRTIDAPAPALAGDSRHALSVRRLTPDECARLQSVPDDWRWPDGLAKTHKYRIVGNGWACGMAKHLSRALGDADPDSRTVIDLFCGGGLGSVGWHGRAWEYERGETARKATA